MTLRETAEETPDPRGWRSEQQRLDEEQQQRAEEDARCEELRKWISWKLAHEMIKSDLIGLYEEVDKLVKTLPKEPFFLPTALWMISLGTHNPGRPLLGGVVLLLGLPVYAFQISREKLVGKYRQRTSL